MSRWVALPALVCCAIAAVLFVRFLTDDRELVSATPSPRPMFEITPVTVPAGQELCISDVTIPADARQLRVQVLTFRRSGPELDIALRARGYGERLTIPAGYPDSALISAPMEPPPDERLAEVCLRHRGAGPIALVGTTEERTQSRPAGTVGGRPATPDSYLAFYAGSASALDQTGEIVDRIGAFRPAFIGPWLVWPLLALVVLGVPAGVLCAVLRGVAS